jgi:signal transduction histidine kinase
MRTGKWWRCLSLATSAGALDVASMTAANGGGLWLGTLSRGLWRYHTDGSLTRAADTAGDAITVVLAQKDGTVWFGGPRGVTRLRGAEVLEFNESKGLPRGGVDALIEGSHGELWVLGPTGLAAVIDGRVIVPPVFSRTPVAGCWSGVRDETSVWLHCPQGLLRIADRELDEVVRHADHTLEYDQFDASDDLHSFPIRGGTSSSIVRSADGRIWFLTRKGLGYVDPGRLVRPAFPPPVYIDAARAGDTAFAIDATSPLPPLSDALEIYFTAISLSHPERLHFRYRLDGADQEWKETRDRSVSYSNLSAGDYRLHVMAANYLGVWSDREAVWAFTIAPRWNETWWFRISIAVFVAALVWGATRVGFAQQAASLKREFGVQLAERTRIAGELHDTLLQGFQGTTMQLHVLATRLLPESPERRRLNTVLGEVQTVLDEGRNAIWAIRESATTGPDLRASFARVAAHANVAAPVFHLTEEGEPRPMNPIQRDILYQLGREALRNAYEHSGAQQIDMHLCWEPRVFRMSVRDNGIGIDDGIRSVGRDGHFGLAGMRERAARLGAAFDLRSAPGRGTELSVSVPAGSIYLHPMVPWHRHVIARLASFRSRRS